MAQKRTVGKSPISPRTATSSAGPVFQAFALHLPILYFCEVWAFRLSRFRYKLVLFRRPPPGIFTTSDPAIVLLNIVLTRPCTVVRRANYIED